MKTFGQFLSESETIIKPGMSVEKINSILKSETLSTGELDSFLFDDASGQFEYFLVNPDITDDKVIEQLKVLQQTVIKYQPNCTPAIKRQMKKALAEIESNYNT